MLTRCYTSYPFVKFLEGQEHGARCRDSSGLSTILSSTSSRVLGGTARAFQFLDESPTQIIRFK